MSSRPSDLTEVFAVAVEGDWPRLVAYVGAIVGRAEAEDVAADAVARAWRHLGGFRGEGSIEGWLLRVARTTAIDHLRARSRRPPVAPFPDDGAIAARSDPTGTVELDLLLDDLDLDLREAFVLTQAAGCRYAEAAEVVGVPVGTIRSRVHRARQALVAAVTADDAGRRTA